MPVYRLIRVLDLVLSSGMVLSGLMLALAWSRRQTEPRLLGTWQSDADRTINAMLGEPPHDDQREAKLRTLFGKMRVTWAPQMVTSDLKGSVDSDVYDVLARDEVSVAIRFRKSKPDPLDFLHLSTLQVIHFEGPDRYWLDSETGAMREWFKRIK